ncbi:MAG: UDP-N-acetylglucosamine 1-carboxyvinyltransferase [Planctomycetota bacterium]|nr:MAG: UDP-N-acetylglucosamine 1-carboxyvinyltransferase [Planctomycetota bacterium]
MDKFVIEGGHPLSGTVEISGSKNAALPLMAAALMAARPCVVRNVPSLSDVRTMTGVLRELGMDADYDPASRTFTASVRDTSRCTAPYSLVKKMRASISVLGPLVAARGYAKVSYPGGCAIGTRPIDLHLKGLSALGVRFKIEHGYIIARAERLKGAEIYLGGHYGSSVLATANVMCAAALAEGETVISHAAAEPEIVDLAGFLNAMGASVEGAGSTRVVVRGVSSLSGADYSVIPDRIEAATFLIAAAMTRSPLTVKGAVYAHLNAVIDKLQEVGVGILRTDAGLEVVPSERMRPVEITTLPYPGFPTDVQAQMMALLALVRGTSFVTERIFPDRFMHVAELNRLGADIRRAGPTAVINGVSRLSGAHVMASDLRASAALVLAGLVAEGTTEVLRIYHIDRGYERIEEKLNLLGARIKRLPAEGVY